MSEAMEIVWGIPDDDGPGDPGNGEEDDREAMTSCYLPYDSNHTSIHQTDPFGGDAP